MEDGNLPLMSDPYAYVIDNRDYEELTEGISRTWTEQLIMFDVDNLEGSYPFAKALYAMYVRGASEETFVMTLYDRWEEERACEAGQEYEYSGRLEVTPDDTGLFDDWKYVPDFRIVYSQDILQSISVYVMLCLYIFIITLAAAAVMTYVRGISVAADNREVFLSLRKLGADESYQKWVLKSQLAKIFTYPGALGCMVGMLFVLVQNWINDRRYTVSEIKNLCLLGGVCILVLLFFYVIYRNVKKKAEEIACDLAETLAEEITPYEEAFACEITSEENREADAVSVEDAKAFITAMYLAPNGVQSRNMKLDGFVVVSTNMGVARAEEDHLVIVFSPRSSVASLQEEIKARLGLLADTFGFKAEYAGEYPGWSYREKSPVREVFCESYRELFGEELKTEALHAGLECGLFSDAIPGLDAIAVGPTLYNVHTPEEHLPLDSFERFYVLLKDVLKRLAE